MKKLYYTIACLLIVSIVSSAVILVLSPEIIPAHYNASGEVDRFGSKYEHLIFPGFSLLMTAVLLGLQRFQKKKNAPELEQIVLLYTLIFSIVLFTVLGLVFGILAIRYQEGPMKIPADSILRLVSIFTGALFLILGNLMPKVRRNSLMGLRTKWSMTSDRVWQQSQRFGGFCMVICGLLTVLMALVLPGLWNLFWMTAMPLLLAVVCSAASYLYWKRDQLPK